MVALNLIVTVIIKAVHHIGVTTDQVLNLAQMLLLLLAQVLLLAIVFVVHRLLQRFREELKEWREDNYRINKWWW